MSLHVMAYGGGVNSTAMLILLKRQGVHLDLILFADTGGERPETYAYVEAMSRWCEANGFPGIVTVRKAGRRYFGETLEEECFRRAVLPSVAYGFKTCSQKFKAQPQDMYCNRWEAAKAEWAAGRKLVKFIGYDADEPHRVTVTEDSKYTLRYPLVDAGWGREECLRAIREEGLPEPQKSACFFCPHMRKPEIKDLKRKHPDLLERALAMEASAELTTVKGLGRRFSWAEFLRDEAGHQDMFDDLGEMPCGCYDGSALQ